ncbi:MAG: zinc ABC transporter substrate-binding protein [Chloroflexi bacterium]|nr:zinc ABC transporter substrate-binding protein [Chloroflexota bacterium]
MPLADFVRNVGGDKVEVTTMIPPGASPHEYGITTTQMKALSKVKAYFKVGSGIEFELTQMDNITTQNSKMLIVDCSEGIIKLGEDPHIWNSPLNAKIMVENICTGLIKVDPGNASIYTKNKNDYIEELNDLDKDIKSRVSGFSNKAFLVYHPSFGYLAKDYGMIEYAIEVEGQEVTPQRLAQSIEIAKQYQLSYIFGAPEHEKDIENAKTIAKAVNGQVVPINALPEHYIDNMKTVVDALCLEFAK